MTGNLFVHLLIAIAAALVGGAVALWLRQSAILGFLVAGLMLSPFTPGFVGPSETIEAVAEVGIIFLMFAVGVQLSLRELLRVGRISLAGGLVQVTLTIALAGAAGLALGFGAVESLVFGAVISNSSSTVLSKILVERGEVETGWARTSLAWSSVQDISTVVIVAVFSALSPSRGEDQQVVLLVKAAVFLFAVVPAALWLLPRVFGRASVLRSREIFILLVATVALGMAWAASLLGISLALGAFLAGVAVGESPTAHRILGDAIPLRDIFSGVFFVSIGMTIDPRFVVEHAGLVMVTVLLTIAGKGALCGVLAFALGCSLRTSVMLGAGLAQSAEFSFLLAHAARELGLIDAALFGAMLASAALSILLAPAVTAGAGRLLPLLQRTRLSWQREHEAGATPAPKSHAIVCGHGRVGHVVTGLLERFGASLVVIDEDPRVVRGLRERGARAFLGDAAQASLLDRAGVASARLLVICIPERMAVRRIVDHAQDVNPRLVILARAHSDRERDELYQRGVAEVVHGEQELALELSRRSGQVLGFDAPALEQAIDALRRSASTTAG
jgi:CPA2 family monovalent cation:H+ antiporter-2